MQAANETPGRTMSATRIANLVISLAMLGIAILFLVTALTTMRYLGDYGPGPGFIPVWVSGAAVLFCLWLVVQSWRGAYDGGSDLVLPGRSLLFFAIIVGSMLLVPVLGLLLALALFVLVTSLWVERTPLWQSVAVTAGLLASLYLLLVTLLNIPLPSGLVGFPA